MAAISTRKLVLQDNWPGVPNQNLGIPTGGFDSTNWTDATTEKYPIGTKIQVYQDFSGLKGPYTMIYLRYYCGSRTGSVGVEEADLSDTGWCIFQQFCDSNCLSADGTAAVFTCTNLGSVDTGYVCGTKKGIIAVACGTLSDHDTTGTGGTNAGAYGWFWCGGVCPMDITFLSGVAHAGVDMSTGGNVAAGEPIYCQVDGASAIEFDGATDLSANICGFALGADA